MTDWLTSVGDTLMNSVVIGMGMVGLVQEAPERYSLDTMMTGFTEGCQLSPALEAFWWSAVNGEKLVLPDDAHHYFSEMQVRNEDEFRELRIPVKGTWLGHNVDHFSFFAGNENGIAVMSLRFDPADSKVWEKFTPLALASQAILDADEENYADTFTEFVSEGGISQYYCDFST